MDPLNDREEGPGNQANKKKMDWNWKNWEIEKEGKIGVSAHRLVTDWNSRGITRFPESTNGSGA